MSSLGEGLCTLLPDGQVAIAFDPPDTEIVRVSRKLFEELIEYGNAVVRVRKLLDETARQEEGYYYTGLVAIRDVRSAIKGTLDWL